MFHERKRSIFADGNDSDSEIFQKNFTGFHRPMDMLLRPQKRPGGIFPKQKKNGESVGGGRNGAKFAPVQQKRKRFPSGKKDTAGESDSHSFAYQLTTGRPQTRLAMVRYRFVTLYLPIPTTAIWSIFCMPI